jgi:hypothetical protein
LAPLSADTAAGSAPLSIAPAAQQVATQAAAAPATVSTSSAPRCDDGPWKGPDDVNIEGRPDSLDPGDRGAVYIWHDSDGWHLRATDIAQTDHQYSGTIRLSPGARFTDFSTVRLQKDDRVWVTSDNVLHYRFNTHNGVDGIDYRVSACDTRRNNETMAFNLYYDGHPDDVNRVRLGDKKQHPEQIPFAVHRDADKITR